MYYGQKNYNDMLGSPALFRIAQAGCFNVSFCNGLKKSFGIDVDPLSLNRSLIDRHVYVDAPPKDGALDDLYYGAISALYPEIVVSGTGKGKPPTNDSLVKFVYKSQTTGNETIHFCWVADAAAGTIIDSWDGQIKSWNVYGGPVEYATYVRAGGVQVNPVAPVVDNGSGAYVVVKDIPGYGTSNNAANHINPANSVGPGTYMVFNRFKGMINVTNKAGVPGSWINPSDNFQAAPPAPAPEPTPAAPAVDANILEVQPGWGLSHCLYNRGYPKDQYSSPEKWQWLAGLNGVSNWQDFKLKPYQKIVCPPFAAPAPEPTPVPAEPVAPPVTETPNQLPTEPTNPFSDEATPATDDFKKTYVEEPGRYVALRNIFVRDMEGKKPMLPLAPGKVNIAGYFFINGDRYYRSHHHAEVGEWYGVPADNLRPLKDGVEVPAVAPPEDEDENNVFAEIMNDLSLRDEAKEFAENLTGRKRVLAIVGTIIGFMERLKFWQKNKQGTK